MTRAGGPHSVGPLALWIPFLVFLLAVLYWQDDAPAGDGVPDTGPGHATVVRGLEGERPSDGLRLRLTPLRADPEQQRFETAALARRWGLGDGEPWRLEVLEGELRPEGVAVRDGDGVALRPLPEDLPAGDPFAALARGAGAPLAPGRSGLLWGRPPGPGAHLEPSGGSPDDPAASVPLEACDVPSDQLPRHLARWEPPRTP